MAVDRCVCFDVSFARMKQFVDEHGGGLEALRGRFGCGRGCAMCVPYIQQMLRTGATSFAPAPPTDSNPDL